MGWKALSVGYMFARGTYLVSSEFERFPLYPRKNVPKKRRIILNVRLLKLGVSEMEWKGKGRSLACFDGTGQEVCCQDFHVRSFARPRG